MSFLQASYDAKIASYEKMQCSHFVGSGGSFDFHVWETALRKHLFDKVLRAAKVRFREIYLLTLLTGLHGTHRGFRSAFCCRRHRYLRI